MARLISIWNALRASYWFIPLLLQFAAFALSWATLAIDRRGLSDYVLTISWIYEADSDGARALLSTIASSMITAASVTFSITIVALTLTASQYGPRLLRNFMRDLINQLTLGVFLATFIYSLIILRTVSEVEGAVFIPYLSVSTAFLLSFLCCLFLIYFIHHISTSISADDVINDVSVELRQKISKVFKNSSSEDDSQAKLSEIGSFEGEGFRPLLAHSTGYVQAIEYRKLVTSALECDATIRLDVRPGSFILRDAKIGALCTSLEAHGALSSAVNSAMLIGNVRTAEQDIEFSIRQLVEVAVRALSPGINDPYTAVSCLDHLGGALGDLLDRQAPSVIHRDESETPRVAVQSFSHAGCISEAFDQIRQFSISSPAVAIRLLEVLALLAEKESSKEVAAELEKQASALCLSCEEQWRSHSDIEDLNTRFEDVKSKLSN